MYYEVSQIRRYRSLCRYISEINHDRFQTERFGLHRLDRNEGTLEWKEIITKRYGTCNLVSLLITTYTLMPRYVNVLKFGRVALKI